MANPVRRAAGGPVLQDALTDALTSAFFEELAAVGYGRLSIEAVARRAGAGKAAVYRRWPSKQAMATDLITKVAVAAAETPDTGTLRGDLRAYLGAAADGLRHPLASKIIPDLLAEAGREPALAESLAEGVGGARRERAADLLRRAIARGELPADLNIPLALDFLAGPLYWRLTVNAAPLEPGYLDELITMLLTAFRAT
ncbi:TetR/AcrR family transcriptional regulator C-terminal ligand-binding domain-containing protein [Nocardia yamanashiensis]|uniref:TetR-like C-terminal domain-containing protein n=1 Tax=Nocardia yamanashiensis TaxID=209247 RepID=UPI001E5C5297|nr:TetR-like C-terminal domain-containing protein [Nocardia yamanashiensis]UGT42317.1 TetR/AcrR family transcriptional regulator C-terminal ligand-binding domain-containing protein [Nocardia yamanashiensis]